MKRFDPLWVPVDAALALCVLAPSLAVFAQVVFRYVLNDPVSWLDEFATLCFAWMTLLGAAVVQRTDAHMSIDLFARLLPARGQAVLYALRFLASAAMLALLFWYGLDLTRRMSFVEYPAMEISRGWLFAILPVCTPLIFYYLVRSALSAWRVIRSGRPVFHGSHHGDVE